MSRQALPTSFFERPVLDVAEDLLSCNLCHRDSDGRLKRLQITEVEAYDGEKDLACHARKGRTARTDIMYGSGGNWYVYLCYGIHWLLNIVTGPVGYPSAVLIRSAGTVTGPGRLTREMGVDGTMNRKPATKATGLWIEQADGEAAYKIQRTTRIGVAYAGPDWANRPYRLVRIDPR